jgi:hypothetical protein
MLPFVEETMLLGATWAQHPDHRSRKALRKLCRQMARVRQSANLAVDINGTCVLGTTITGTIQSGGPPAPASGTVIGASVDLINADTYCNVIVVGNCSSGQLRVQVQTSDTDTSGNFTDPTSGLAQLPGVFQSGGLLWINSGGLLGGTIGTTGFVSGQAVTSGFSVANPFQRPGRFARANLLSGDFGTANVFFLSNLKTTGSGGGFSLSPTSGSVNV